MVLRFRYSLYLSVDETPGPSWTSHMAEGSDVRQSRHCRLPPRPVFSRRLNAIPDPIISTGQAFDPKPRTYYLGTVTAQAAGHAFPTDTMAHWRYAQGPCAQGRPVVEAYTVSLVDCGTTRRPSLSPTVMMSWALHSADKYSYSTQSYNQLESLISISLQSISELTLGYTQLFLIISSGSFSRIYYRPLHP